MSNTAEVPLLTKSSLQSLLQKRFGETFSRLGDIPSPSLLLNADKAARRIAHAVKNNESITIVGDYDVDGVTATALCILFFREIGYPVKAIIPNRFTDGYGISPHLLERIDTDLIMTVDNGINAFEAASRCKERGIDLIITDHHTPAENIPDAYAVVDPKLPGCPYPFKEICGAQVAWLMMGLVKKELALDIDMKRFLGLLALAVIADVMPLVGINRAIVQAGLAQMMSTPLPAFVIIRDFLDKSAISSEDIGFQIAPRLNSAGRLEDAAIALAFLTAQTQAEAYRHFETLDQLNSLRKATEADVTELAMLQVDPADSIIVVAGNNWHEGVVGIAAARLVQRFEKPAIVLSIEDGHAKGSARSIGDIDIYGLIKGREELLEKFGGHKMAAGLSLRTENIDAFRKAINADAKTLHPDAFLPCEELIGELDSGSIDFELLEILERFEPYGEGNPRPRFLARDAHVVAIKYFGNDGSHSRISVRLHTHERQTHELIAFRRTVERPETSKMTCSYTVNKNEFNGNTSLQMLIERIY